MARKTSRVGALVTLVALVAGCGSAPATDGTTSTTTAVTTTTATPVAGPDVIFFGGTIVTMDDAVSGDAVAIIGDTIEAVGAASEILALAGTNTQVIDLGGRALYPGFMDGHSHWYAYSGGWVGLVGNSEINDAILERGWTSMTEMLVDPEALTKLIEAGEGDEIRPRLAVYLTMNYAGLEKRLLGDWYHEYEPRTMYGDRVELLGAKFIIDNGWGSFVHWTAEELTSAVAEAHQRGWNIAAHTISHEAHDLVLDAYEAAIENDGLGAGFRIEHLLQLRDDQIDRIERLGIVASMQIGWPVFDFTLEEGFQSMVEGDDPAWYARWQDILAAGIPAIASVDGPGGEGDVLERTTASPMGLVHDAVVRQTDVVDNPPAWLAEQSLTIDQALRLLTIDAARATGDDDRKGSITPGKWADLVVLSADPRGYEDDPAQILDIEVLMTMIGGYVEYCGDSTVCPDTEGRGHGPEGVVSASATRDDQPPDLAFDGVASGDSFWSSGADAPQRIQIDLAAPIDLRGVALWVFQNPPGDTVHHLEVRLWDAEWERVHTFSGFTQTGDRLEWVADAPISGVTGLRVITAASPSWPEWYEITLNP